MHPQSTSQLMLITITCVYWPSCFAADDDMIGVPSNRDENAEHHDRMTQGLHDGPAECAAETAAEIAMRLFLRRSSLTYLLHRQVRIRTSPHDSQSISRMACVRGW